MRRPALVPLLFLTALTGCARYHPGPLEPEVSAAALETRRLDDAGLHEFMARNLRHRVEPWPPAEWDLASLTLAAFYFHADLDVARARWGVAKAGMITAGARPNPALEADAERVSHTREESPWILGFSFDLPIETFGKRGHRVAQARSLSESARLAVSVAAWKVRSRLRSRLVDLWAAEARLALDHRALDLREEIVRLTERRLDVGAASQPDVTRERIAPEQSRVAVREGERELDQARARVAAAVGVPIRSLDGQQLRYPPYDDPSPSALAPDELRRQALLGRADLLALLEDYRAAQSALQLEIARQYPDIRLGPGFTWEQGEHHYVLGLSLPLLFNRNRGPIAEAEAHRQEVAARFVARQAEVLAELDQGRAAEQAAARALAAVNDVLAEQKRRVDQARAAFEAGETDRLTLRGAELERALGERSRLDALVERQAAIGRLEDALQCPVLDAEVRLAVTEEVPRPRQSP